MASIQADHLKRVKQQRSDLFFDYEESPLIRFFLIRLSEQNTFDYHEIQRNCGLSEDQLDYQITEMQKKGLLKLRGGKFVLTEHFKQVVNVDKLKKQKEEQEELVFKKYDNYLPKNFNKVFNGYNDDNTSI